MTPKTKLFEWIEDYCLDNLEKLEKEEFENELKKNKELREELKFEKEIKDAVTEEDILHLREKLRNAAEGKADKKQGAAFDLFEDFSDIRELTSAVSPEELLDYYDALPKVHIYQHGLISNENIHHFYKEQNLPEEDEEFSFSGMEEDADFEGLEEALLEKDIMDLRGTLSRVSKSVQVPFSTEEIDAYLQGELSPEKREAFEKELKVNRLLQREVRTHSELENALEELDVTSLREKMSDLMNAETSWNVSEKDIEDFIEEELDEDREEAFRAEFEENTDLKAEVALRKSVNDSLGEQDVMRLRDQLHRTRDVLKSKEMKSIVPDSKTYKMHWWKAGVAIVLILFAFSGVIRSEFGSVDRLYNTYYQSPQWSPQRSVATGENHLRQANLFFTRGEYEKAISLYDRAIEKNSETFVFRFYKAASLQNLGKYREAIPEYNQVIRQGDNIFIEEAEWYRSLCYMKAGENEKAREQLLAIIERKGYYESDAKAVLRRLRYSFR